MPTFILHTNIPEFDHGLETAMHSEIREIISHEIGKSKDFVLCVELPILSKRKSLKMGTSKSNERARLGGKKKVNALRDGYLILIGMIKLFFKN